jgi:hypothetical protein
LLKLPPDLCPEGGKIVDGGFWGHGERPYIRLRGPSEGTPHFAGKTRGERRQPSAASGAAL